MNRKFKWLEWLFILFATLLCVYAIAGSAHGQSSAQNAPAIWKYKNDSTFVIINRNASADTFLAFTDSLGISYIKGKDNATIAFLDVLKILDFSLYTGGANIAAYDTADVPVDGDVLTWGTGNVINWQPDAGAGTDVFDERNNVANDTASWADDDNDTNIVIWDDDAGNARIEVGRTGANAAQTLRIKVDTIDILGDIITDFSSTDISVSAGQLFVIDDSHNHIISNIDAFSSADLAGKLLDEVGTGVALFETAIVRTDGSNPLTANWAAGDFDITGLEAVEADTLVSPFVLGGTGTTSDLSLKTTSGIGAAGADMHFLVGNNGATEAMTILNDGRVGINTIAPGTDLAGSTPDYAAGTVVLHLKNTTAASVLALEGQAGVIIDYIDLGGLADDKVLRFKLDGGIGKFFSLTDIFGIRVDNILVMDMGTGAITLAVDLDVTEGGTGVSTLTDGGVLIGNAAGDIVATAVLTEGQLLIGDGATDPAIAAMSGDATMASTGALTISTGAITNTKIAANAVDDTRIDFGTGANQVNIIDIPSPTTWSTVYWNATVPVALALGASGDVLTSNGTATAPTWQTPGAASARWVDVGTPDTVSLVGVSDTLMTLGDTSNNFTTIETQNSNGFLFLDPVVITTAAATELDITGNGNQFVFIHGTGGNGARLAVDEDNTAAGDADVQFRVGPTTWTMGADNTDADAFVLSRNTTLGTNNIIKVTTSDVIQFNSAYTFPTADGGANQVLQTDGAGALTFQTVSGASLWDSTAVINIDSFYVVGRNNDTAMFIVMDTLQDTISIDFGQSEGQTVRIRNVNRIDADTVSSSGIITADRLTVATSFTFPISGTPVGEGLTVWDQANDRLLIGNGDPGTETFVPASQISGDATMTTAGVVTIQDGAVQESDVDITNTATTGQLLTKGSGDNFTWSGLEDIIAGTDDSLRWIAASDTALLITSSEAGDTRITVGQESDATAITLSIVLDTIVISGDNIIDFAGAGLAVTSGVLDASVSGGSSAEIVDNTVTMADDMNTFTKVELETQTTDVANFAEADGDVFTGVHDFGGVTTFELWNATNPATAIIGQLAVDVDDTSIELFDGVRSVQIPMHFTKSILIYNPDLITDTVPIFTADSAMMQGGFTITHAKILASVDGAYTLELFEFTSADPPVRVGAGAIGGLIIAAADQRADTVTFTDATIAVGNELYLDTPATDIEWIHVEIRYFIIGND